ncbi:MAG: ABC transporter substrate-binding protein/permease [Planctomycetes bacterium]|nr:ABC transporter substrate-binding protein/permease [Planctomycetota bacterium]
MVCRGSLLALVVLTAATSLRAQEPLRWGADAEGGAPYIFKDPQDPRNNIGFEVDLAEALEQELGREIEFVQYNYAELALGLQRGDFDFAMNGLEVTPDRQRRLRMSRPYYVYRLQLAARADDDRFETLEQLKAIGGRVGTLDNTAASRLLEQKEFAPVLYDGQAEPYQDLELGRLDAVLMDLPIAEYYARPNLKLKFVGESFGAGAYAIAFRENQEELAQQFDAAIVKLAASGDLERIYRKWGIWNEDQEQLSGDVEIANILADSSQGLTLDRYLPLLWDGAKMTIYLSVLSMALAVAIGLPVSISRLYGPWPLRAAAISYVEFFRGIPVLLLLYILYYGMPTLLARWGIVWTPGNAFIGVLAFGLNYAAYEAEIYRAGISSIPHGQWEAAASLGMSRFTTFRRIILPQTWRIVLPPMTNDFVALFKDTSIVSVIAVVELTKQYQILAKSSLKYMEIGLATAALYLLMSVPLGYLSRWMERRMSAG